MSFGRLRCLIFLIAALGVSTAYAGPLAVVTNFTEGYSAGSVAFIDTANDQLVGAVRVGVNPAGVAITPDGKTAVVACAESRDLWFIDLSVRPPKVISSLNVDGGTGGPFYPVGVAMSPDGQYVALTVGVNAAARTDASPGNQFIKIVSVPDRQVVQTIQMPQEQNTITAEAAGISSKGAIVVAGPSSQLIYSLTFQGGQIALPEDPSDAEGRLRGPFAGTYIAITPDGATALVPAARDKLQSLLITDQGKIGEGPQLSSGGAGAQSVAITPDGKKAYVRNFYTPQNNTAIFQVGAGGSLKDTGGRLNSTGFPGEILALVDGGLFVGVPMVAVTPDGKKVYAPNPFLNILEVFEGDKPTPIKRIFTGANPFGVAVQAR